MPCMRNTFLNSWLREDKEGKAREVEDMRNRSEEEEEENSGRRLRRKWQGSHERV